MIIQTGSVKKGWHLTTSSCGYKKQEYKNLMQNTQEVFSPAPKQIHIRWILKTKKSGSDILTYLKIKIPEIIISNPYTPDAYVSWSLRPIGRQMRQPEWMSLTQQPCSLLMKLKLPWQYHFHGCKQYRFYKSFKADVLGHGANGGTAGAVSIYTKRIWQRKKMKEMQLQAFEGLQRD